MSNIAQTRPEVWLKVSNDIILAKSKPRFGRRRRPRDAEGSTARLLRQHAYEPILFSSAEAFKNHTDFETAACVILDINLNDGSGIELRQGLKAAGVSVPVIYMTGNEDIAVRKAALASGCITFLTKPFSAQELIEPLKRAAAGRS